MWEMQILIDGEWYSIGPSLPPGAPPFRWNYKADAEIAMQQLYGHLSEGQRQLVRIPVGG